MPKIDEIGLHCLLSRGGFFSERVFRVPLADGKEQHVGATPAEYCFTPEGQPLALDKVEKGASVPGIVAARIVSQENGTLWVSVPDGEVIPVGTDVVTPRPQEDREQLRRRP